MKARPSRYIPSHRTRATIGERQDAVHAILCREPGAALTMEQIYVALRYSQTKAELKSCISCLRTRGLVEIAQVGDSHSVATTYRAPQKGQP
jgi:sulfur relay (sulfurtransferase) complex TusBCD TusD component (DsrE family)